MHHYVIQLWLGNNHFLMYMCVTLFNCLDQEIFRASCLSLIQMILVMHFKKQGKVIKRFLKIALLTLEEQNHSVWRALGRLLSYLQSLPSCASHFP